MIIKFFMNKFYLLVIAFSITLLVAAGCSKAVMDEIDQMIKANFGSYTSENPLTIFVMPFMPARKLDPESVIGLIAWKGAVEGVKNSAYFSEGKVVYKGLVNPEEYIEVLRTDKFWDEMGKGEGIKGTLRRATDDYGVNGMIYGLYQGAEAELKLTVYFFSRKDDVVLKQRTYAKSTVKELRELIRRVEADEGLLASQISLIEMIQEKIQVVTVKLIRKYVEGI